jgi:hypothetical protein
LPKIPQNKLKIPKFCKNFHGGAPQIAPGRPAPGRRLVRCKIPVRPGAVPVRCANFDAPRGDAGAVKNFAKNTEK